jgi:hypothetical protein
VGGGAEQRDEADQQREYNSDHWLLPVVAEQAGLIPERRWLVGVEAGENCCRGTLRYPVVIHAQACETLEILHLKA